VENTHLSVLVALRTGNLSGVETYAEQVASAAAAAGHTVTLVVAGPELARAVGNRLVIGAEPLAASPWRSASRKVPTLAMGEMRSVLDRRLRRLGEWFDIAHLNQPGLAVAARPFAAGLVVRAWFYPHAPVQRLIDTWRHTGAVFPRSGAMALKGLSHYWNDRRGYAMADCAVAPTAMLADQLRSQGIKAVECPPPGRRPATHSGHGRDRWIKRVAICCGDMSHPRKNVRAGLEAVRIVGLQGTLIDLELIGGNTERLQRELRALPSSVRVITPGRLTPEEVDERLGRADALLVPSLYEEWGYVATEALLAGTPVVAFPVYPFAQILEKPLGACARDLSPHALAVALREILEAPHGRSAVACSADRLFGAEAIGKRLGQIWRDTAFPVGEPIGVAAAASL